MENENNIKNMAYAKSKLAVIAGVTILLIIAAFCGYKVHTLSSRQEKIKKDYSAINDISFGLLSISEWRNKIDTLVKDQLKNLTITNGQQQDIEGEIEQILNALIDKAVSMINQPKKTLGGKIKKLAFNAFINVDDLHKQVPVFAKKIIEEINKPSSKKRMADLAQSKINELEKETYDSAENIRTHVTDSIFRQYDVRDNAVFNKKTTAELSSLRRSTYGYTYCLLGCIIMILGLWWLLRNKSYLHTTLFLMSIISAFILLIAGVTTTMIEVDARISSLNFKLIGENISFNNQVLFFQSKSILDVVEILIKTGKVDSVLVGFLILSFSVLFPVFKLLSTGIYLLGKSKWSKNKVVKYFAFKSGKWSMADVMVVAILMTYIGFNGILNSQLAGLNIHNDYLSSITTNNTSLQPAYLVFTCFVIYGLILAQILKKITGHKSE